MTQLRATTNLVIPETLQLPKQDLKRNFMYIYNRGFKELPAVFMSKLWVCKLFPEAAQNAKFGTDKRRVRDLVAMFGKKVSVGQTRLKKINDAADPYFTVAVPLWRFNPTMFSQLGYVANVLSAPGSNSGGDEAIEHPVERELQNTADMGNTDVKFINFKPADIIASFPGLDIRGVDALKHCLLGVSIEHAASYGAIFATFKINKAEAEQLTTTPWLEIRPIDLYPILMQWVASVFGTTGTNPLVSFPISKIARTMPQVHEGDARVDQYGISIDKDGNAFYLPKSLDSTLRYEDLFSQVGNQDNDVFALTTVKSAAEHLILGKEEDLKLPRNIPVLIDWINNKYAYTTTTGMLKVQELGRYQKVEATHACNILRREDFSSALISRFTKMAETGGVSTKVDPTEAELASVKEFDPVAYDQLVANTNDIVEFALHALAVMKREYEDPIIKLAEVGPESEYPLLRCIARWIAKAHDGILNHLDAVYHRYSVTHVSTTLAMITLIAKYASDFPAVAAIDARARTAATNQSVEDGWEPPSIPLLSPKVGMLPHQKKVRNLLKDSPDFAILPIQAGGGKSPMTIIDILYEIKANRSQPYLILCPSHLVAQYVKELVFFTHGQLNAIPINSYTVVKNGLDRLGKMLESAPRNTVVVADYDILRYRQQQVCYGTTNTSVYPIIEFLRQFKFGYAMLDESHVVKNDSARSRACMALIADVPKKRLASGTMAHDSPSDLAVQIAMLDPTLFGSKTDFNERFGAVVRGERVMEWKPGAQQEIMRIIKTRIVVAGAMRKEWAALLPKAHEMFHRAELSDPQRQCYNLLFAETMEAIRLAAATNPRLADFVNGGKKKEEGDVDDEDASDEFQDEDLAAMLNPYLARIERFLTAPGSDELGKKMLHGDELLSPKVTVIHEIMKKHLDAKIPGKILVFTNYTASAEEIYNRLPPDMKKRAILYVANDKIEAGAQFENDPSKDIMIGVEYSMNTGLNLQFASRLIRVETVWNPGTLEQGNSRVNRPELKKESRREAIYFDWVMVNRTIDITKISRLISKIIANSKFENVDNPAYEALPEVPVMKMTLDTVEHFNDWGDPDNPTDESTLALYGNAYREFKQVQADDYAEYRLKHGEMKLAPCVVAETPNDARMMHTVPYTPGLEIYGQDDLGLVRVDDFLRLDTVEGEDEGEGGKEKDEDEEAKKAKSDLVAVEKRQRLTEALVGQVVHTEFGEGVIRGVNFINRFVTVDFPNGYSKMKFASTFIVTRKDTSTKDIRNQLLKGIGKMPIDAPIDSPVPSIIQDATSVRLQNKKAQEQLKKDKVKLKKEQASISVELSLSVANGFLSLSYFTEKDNIAGGNALQALGFRPAPQFYYAEVNSAQRLAKQMALWHEHGMAPDPKMTSELMPAFNNLHTLLQSGKVRSHNAMYKYASTSQLRNFYRMEHRPNTNPDLFKPYPLVEDGKAYIVLPIQGQAGTKKAIRFKAPGIRWHLSDPLLTCYGLNINKVLDIIKSVKNAGIMIANEKELKRDFLKLRKVKVRDESEEI